ncbi:MAG: D-2-hydroxyacid dehydrogenase [Pirellulales bacterium]|nr:D-2-hydroxyacid dehydrogenase [Pirellulales bacterium]
MTRIVLCYPVESRHLAQIATAAPDAEIVDAGQERVANEIMAADIFCGHAKVPMPWDEVIRRARLRWIQSSAAGLDHCLVPAVVESDVIVTSASGVLADQVAEHTLALLTALTRSLPDFFRAQQRREFVRRPTRDLTGATVGIVGLGGVGRRLVEVLAPFKVRILATDWYPIDKPGQVESLWPPERLDELLPRVDVLILAVPLTDRTRGMIGKRQIDLMKPGALLVNVARGALVVENDLVAALRSGHLAGAAVDVTATEPLPTDSALWNLPQVIITPHVGGQSARRIENMTNFFCDNLRRHQTGQPLRNLVDKRLGFPTRTAWQ